MHTRREYQLLLADNSSDYGRSMSAYLQLEDYHVAFAESLQSAKDQTGVGIV